VKKIDTPKLAELNRRSRAKRLGGSLQTTPVHVKHAGGLANNRSTQVEYRGYRIRWDDFLFSRYTSLKANSAKR